MISIGGGRTISESVVLECALSPADADKVEAGDAAIFEGAVVALPQDDGAGASRSPFGRLGVVAGEKDAWHINASAADNLCLVDVVVADANHATVAAS